MSCAVLQCYSPDCDLPVETPAESVVTIPEESHLTDLGVEDTADPHTVPGLPPGQPGGGGEEGGGDTATTTAGGSSLALT